MKKTLSHGKVELKEKVLILQKISHTLNVLFQESTGIKASGKLTHHRATGALSFRGNKLHCYLTFDLKLAF